MIFILSFSFVGIFLIVRLLISLQFKPMRHVLNSAFFHFCGRGVREFFDVELKYYRWSVVFDVYCEKFNEANCCGGFENLVEKKFCHRYRSRTSFFCSLWPSLVGGFVFFFFFYYHRSILAHSNSMMFPISNPLGKKSSITICMSPTATTWLVMSITSEMTFRSSFVSLKFHIPTAD